MKKYILLLIIPFLSFGQNNYSLSFSESGLTTEGNAAFIEAHVLFENLNNFNLSPGEFVSVSFWYHYDEYGDANNSWQPGSLISFGPHSLTLWPNGTYSTTDESYLYCQLGFDGSQGEGARLDAYNEFRNTWNHLVAVFYYEGNSEAYTPDNSFWENHKLFINGELQELEYFSPTDVLGQDFSSLRINGDYSNNGSHGTFDEVSLWRKELSEQDVEYLYYCSPNLFEDDLIGYWNFENVEDGVVLDQSDNENHGVIHLGTSRDDVYIPNPLAYLLCEEIINPDIDGDGVLNFEDEDIDGDGLLNFEDEDMDGDGIINSEDNNNNNGGSYDIWQDSIIDLNDLFEVLDNWLATSPNTD